MQISRGDAHQFAYVTTPKNLFVICKEKQHRLLIHELYQHLVPLIYHAVDCYQVMHPNFAITKRLLYIFFVLLTIYLLKLVLFDR